MVLYKISSYMSEVLRMPIDEIGYYGAAINFVNGLRLVANEMGRL